MSLGVAIKGPEGVVLAADCRVTIGVQPPGAPGAIVVHYDNATKLLNFSSEPHGWVGAVTYGLGLIGQRTAHSYLPEFELGLPAERLHVEDYARKLGAFFMERWKEGSPPADYNGPSMTFLVGGYDERDAYGKVFLMEVPRNPEPQPRNAAKDDFGMTWGGQLEIASRIVQGWDPALPAMLKEKLGLEDDRLERALVESRPHLEFRVPYHLLPLQDCIDMATFLIRTTMTAQRLAAGIRGVGGPIEVAIITRTRGFQYIQQKVLHGEAQQSGGGMS